MFQSQIGDAAIRDTVAAVFRNAEYNVSLKSTIGRKLGIWLQSVLDALGTAAREHPVLFKCVMWLTILTVVAIVARSAYLAYRRAALRAQAGRAGISGPGDGGPQNAWLLAQRYAASGKYTEAAHAIYWHLLQWLAQRERIILHPSKTVGDYARDLRRRSSRWFSNYREFARSYEVVIYRLGQCDRERYQRLLSLASAITQNHG